MSVHLHKDETFSKIAATLKMPGGKYDGCFKGSTHYHRQYTTNHKMTGEELEVDTFINNFVYRLFKANLFSYISKYKDSEQAERIENFELKDVIPYSSSKNLKKDVKSIKHNAKEYLDNEEIKTINNILRKCREQKNRTPQTQRI